jgi:hypothetical protein
MANRLRTAINPGANLRWACGKIAGFEIKLNMPAGRIETAALSATGIRHRGIWALDRRQSSDTNDSRTFCVG